MTATKRRNFFIILILGALSTVTPFAIDMYLPSFAQIADDMHTTVAKVSLSLSSYFVGFALGQLFYGPILDRFGRKNPLYVGLGLFIIACLGCMQAQNVEQLIAFRVLQALAGCVAQVAAMAMVRDFFPVKESAKIISLLILILGVSPLFAPTTGSFITVTFGWKAVFIILSIFAAIMMTVIYFFLPEGHKSDKSISLSVVPILKGYIDILKHPQFYTYAFSGAFAFSGLLVYVTGAPIIFMDGFHVSAKMFSGIFAFLSIGFIGSNQINIFLLRRFQSAHIFQVSIIAQIVGSLIFLILVLNGMGLYGTIGMFLIMLSTLGFSYPNAAALALAPFSKTAGSASALIGFMQIAIGAAASSCIGLFDSHDSLPVVGILFGTAVIAALILTIGKRNIKRMKHVDTSVGTAIGH